MQTLNHNLEMVHGDTTTYKGTVLDENGGIVNPTGGTFWFTVKTSSAPAADNDSDAAKVFQVTSAGGAITITDAANGQIQVVIPANQSYSPSFTYADTVYYYDLQMKDVSGKIQTLSKGRLTVFADITRTTT